jgi:CheY-like chemotaxis protein
VTRKILLADDSLTIQKVVELTFSDGEYELVCVSNGQLALDRVAEQAPDLILADVVMPEKNGYEVCEAIKANPATARIPVVLLSGTFEPFDRERAERLGCDAIVSKPFDSQQLLRQVEALLARSAEETPSASTAAIAIMTNPAPPPAPEHPAEAGFSPEDFTGSIRKPAEIAGGADLFEEEYGQADVDSAIAAFEKAHPEVESAEEDATSAAMAPEEARDTEEADLAGIGDADETEDEMADEVSSTADWIREEPEPPLASEFQPPAAAPAPFWVPREPEPEVQPIPFAADDSASRRPEVEAARADEAPTGQVALSHDFAPWKAPETPAEPPAGEEGGGERAEEERTAEISITETKAVYEIREQFSGQGAGAETGGSDAGERELEALAQQTTIDQLKDMLSSVSRSAGTLSDDEIDRLASRVVERLSDRIVREIAWEVIPDVAEVVIRQRIKELEAGIE